MMMEAEIVESHVEEDEVGEEVPQMGKEVGEMVYDDEAQKSVSVEIPHFPTSLSFITNVKQEIPKHLYERLKIYYIGITKLLHYGNQHQPPVCAVVEKDDEESPKAMKQPARNLLPPSTLVLIHQYCRLFKGLAYSEQVLFPTSFIQQFCVFCDLIQIVGLTTTMRIRPRTKHSKINKKLKAKMRNEMVFKCIRCEKVTRRFPVYCRGNGQPKHKKTQGGVEEEVKEEEQRSAIASNSNQSKDKTSVQPSTKKGFSFLQSVSNLQPTKSAIPTKTAITPVNKKKDKKKQGKPVVPTTPTLDFIPFTPPTPITPSSSSLLGKRQGSSLMSPPLSSSPTVNLIELERLNKKKRRKSKESNNSNIDN